MPMSFTLLGHRYQVLQTLGAGGFGTTYLAEDLQMPSRRKCVIKQLKPIANNPQVYRLVQERFQREAAILETLGDASSQIPKLYAYLTEAGEFYLIQEWIEGMTLQQKVQEGTVSAAVVQQILLSLLPVLSYVHSNRIVHRDIKPDNIILRQRDHQPVLIDFGAVRETMGTVVTAQGSTASSIVIGTPGFMPSEQAAGRPLYSSDLYSLGLTMIYLLTAKVPQDLEVDPASGEIVWRKYAPQVSPQLAALLDKAIQYHPRDRYPTAEAMLADLQKNSVPTLVSPPVPVPPQAQQNPAEVPQTIISGSSPASPASPAVEQFDFQPPAAPVQTPPAGLARWNWGATLLPGFWAINNRTSIGLIAWSGIVTCGLGWLPISIMLGAKGNEWAWRNREWRSPEAFKANQRAWATAGLIVWGIYGVVAALLIALVSLSPEADDRLLSANSSPALNSRDGQTTNVFGEPLTLSEPTVNINGTWKLNYTIGSVTHEGMLTMQDRIGTLIITTNANQPLRIQQTMQLWQSDRGLVLLGYNPIDLNTQTANPTYAPDNFLFETQSDSSVKATVCDDAQNCTDVAVARQP